MSVSEKYLPRCRIFLLDGEKFRTNLLVLFFAYRDAGGRFSKKNIITNMVLTAGVMVFIYLVFTLLMGYRM